MMSARHLLRRSILSQLPTRQYRAFTTTPFTLVERPTKADDSDRTAQSPKSSDEKILDRAQEGEKNEPAFTEREAEEKDESMNSAGEKGKGSDKGAQGFEGAELSSKK